MTGKKSRVIIDNLSFVKSGRNTMKLGDTPPLGKRIVSFSIECVCSVCKTSVVQRWRPTSTFDEPLDALGKAFMEDEDRLLYLPPRLLGYAVNHKVWGQSSVEKLEVVSPTIDIDKNGPYWKELELEEESKNHLMAFVQHHRTWRDRKLTPGNENKAADNFDIIEGKGQGLVVLLHGPPGVSKTLAAETIVMATGRPLLTVSVAEIGVAYQQAEKNLTEVFVDAARWEAVLLMDEAEVFIEQRSTQDLERNALVSVMLRCLEYFEGKPKSTYHHLSALLLQHTGIVIMTTNRVKAIDVAIQSRIQLAIRYHDLNRDQRLSIYKNRLKYISDDDIENREELVKSLQTSPLIRTRASDDPTNGRQIRNIVTYALALARSEGSRMNINHLTRVAETTSTFTDSMREITRKQRLKSEVEFEDQR
jgi:hypothetical protein